MTTPDMTIILNAHREGLLAADSIQSARRAKEKARLHGYQVEWIAVLDRADELTIQVFDDAAAEHGLATLRTEFGDLGLARNAGVARASGRMIAFLDSDDLWCEDWLTLALDCAARDSRRIVWHPHVNLYFGAEPHIFRHVDMEDAEYDPLSLFASNYWTALCVAPRDLLLEIPYPSTDLAAGFGYEDWSWNQLTISQGILHKVVPGATHAIRQRRDSLVRRTNAAGAVCRPTELVHDYIRRRSENPDPVVRLRPA